MRQPKKYAKVRDRETGKLLLVHRKVAAELLGRPLLQGEVVHHRDGDSTNNTRENLLVLPSQAYHAHLEQHLRRQKRGMPALFPDLFHQTTEDRTGTLFEYVSL